VIVVPAAGHWLLARTHFFALVSHLYVGTAQFVSVLHSTTVRTLVSLVAAHVSPDDDVPSATHCTLFVPAMLGAVQ
jgi:hypothetical protein